MMRLPVATGSTVRREALKLMRQHRKGLLAVLFLQGGAALASLAGPWILGSMVEGVTVGTTASRLNLLVGILVVAVIIQATLTRYAQRQSMVLGEKVFAQLRENFMYSVVDLPLSVVEQAGSGDLISRTTNDIDRISHSVRFAIPRILIAMVTIVFTLGAILIAGPLIGIVVFVGVPLIVFSTRWYLKRASAGYHRELAAYASLNGTISESINGAQTVDALNLSPERLKKTDTDIRECFDSERYTLWLRSVWFPQAEFAFYLPLVSVLAWGGFLAAHDMATIGQITAIALYALQLIDPVNELIMWMDEVQIGATSLSRMIGINEVPPDRTEKGAKPRDEHVQAERVRFAYRPGHDVLHDVSLDLIPGERLAMVGPSGAGKSTMGRLLAGVNPPTSGRVTVGEVPLVDLPLESLRHHVALVTQENHVFVGSLADNLYLAAPDATEDELWNALDTVGAREWAKDLPQSLDTELGSGGLSLTPAQAQQLSLARLVLLDPATLVLDEATSLIDPRVARSLERSLSSVLQGRTVVAIAHRLHTAHDADRIAVVDGGRITEMGSHTELIEAEGDYASLWRSWHG